MELSLTKHDLFKSGSTARGCLRVLPKGKKLKQKVVVGDLDGVVQLFSVRKGNTVTAFRNPPLSHPIRSVDLGGSNPDKPDSIFVAFHQNVHGISLKGRAFFKFETRMTENVEFLCVRLPFMYLCGEFLFQQYMQTKETAFYVSPDRINDMCQTKGFVTLACQDRFARRLYNGEVTHEVSLDAPGSAVREYKTPTEMHEGTSSSSVCVGTSHGTVHEVTFSDDDDVARKGWKIESIGNMGSVESLLTFDITKDGVNDVLIGRSDGQVDVFGFDISPDEPQKVYTYQMEECITSLDHGCVSTPDADDVIVSTFSGIISAFRTSRGEELVAQDTDHPVDASATGGGADRAKQQRRIRTLRAELDKLHEEVRKKQEKVDKAQMLRESRGGFNVSDCRISHHFHLVPETASYSLSVEVDVPIQSVVVESEVAFEVFELTGHGILTESPSESMKYVGSIRLVEDGSEKKKRFSVSLQCREGVGGILRLFIVPEIDTPPISRVIEFPIRILSLHEITRDRDVLTRNAHILNTLKMTGEFSFSDVHAWVSEILPEVPHRMPDQENADLVFRSTFLQSNLHITFFKGECICKSEDMNVLSIIRNYIMKAATQHRIRISSSTDVVDDSFDYMLNILHPLIEHQLDLSRQVRIITALKELSMHEGEEILAPDLVDTLKHEDEINEEFAKQPKKLDHLFSIVEDLYKCRCQFKGTHGDGALERLDRILRKEYTLGAVASFFQSE
eukprot:TRINITY_DN12667_c0_g1_i1.p1 TRINITY_DN12667_c0_g1~~TRINITY_DN12667_c0_g1_i1.p1  ORF type:complete len:733 (+),score=191.56 TRINITY_DN12667_c0_g1_i1:81-2279(+)